MENPIFDMLKNLFAGGQNNFSSNNFASQDKNASFSQTQNRAYDYYPKEAFNWQNQNTQNNGSTYNENVQNNQQTNTDQNQSFNLNNIFPMLMSLSKNGSLSSIMEALSPKKQSPKTASSESNEKSEESAPTDEILL